MPGDYRDLLKKCKVQEGDYVELVKDGQPLKGYVLPSADPSTLALKLSSGYNVGVVVSADLTLQKLDRPPARVGIKSQLPKMNPALPKIAILHTGGTIASRINYSTGGVYAAFTPDDLVSMYPELTQVANFETKIVASMMSEDMRFSNYQMMIKAIEEAIRKGGIQGIILGHGTDTMTYTAAALSFALENLPVPVIMVGAQRSSDRGSSDAAINLICAAEFIKQTDFAGVGICMHEKSDDDRCVILPGTKTRKMHTSRRDAFKPINDKPIARIYFRDKRVEYLRKDYARADAKKKFKAWPGFEERVGLLKSHPNMHPEELLFYAEKKYQGLVVEGTGLGHMPTNTPENIPNYEALKKLLASGCLVVMASQCIYGRVHGHVYTNLRRLSEIGVIFGEDMLGETAFVKLAWLLGNFPREKVVEMLTENLRGEITRSTRLDTFDVESD